MPKSHEIAPLGHSTNPPVNPIICLFLTHTLTFTPVSRAQGVGRASRAVGWGVDCHGLGILRKTDEAWPTLPGLQSSGGATLLPQEVGEWEPPLGHEGDPWILCTIHVPLWGPR